MKDNIKILSTVLLTFLIMFTTSTLLDLEWVSKSTARITLTILLMLVELYIGVLIFKDLLKQ